MQGKGAGQEGMQEQLLSCHWGVVQRLEKSAGVQGELFRTELWYLMVRGGLNPS